MNEPIPKLELLSNNLSELDFGEFLKSREFKRYLIKAKLDESWRNFYNNVKNNRTFLSVGMDHEKYDSLDALNLLMNGLYEKYNDFFFKFINDLLTTFAEWTSQPFETSEIIEDLELLNCPDEIIKSISNLNIDDKIAVPKSEVSPTAWNAKKLEDCINKMDSSIKDGEFNLTLTYAYTCLEGIFKTYIEQNIQGKQTDDELAKLSKIVKFHLKEHFDNKEEKFPEPMLNLIGTITNAVSNARNNFSESHFDKTSDKCLAEFVRDCVNSVGRLILKFVK